MAPLDTKTLDTLESLHPPASDAVPPLPEDAPTVQQVDTDALAKLVRRDLANGSAPAASGWTGDLVLALIDDSDCLNGLASLVKDIINGTLPVEARTLLVSSILIGIKKPSGGTRPGRNFVPVSWTLLCISRSLKGYSCSRDVEQDTRSL